VLIDRGVIVRDNGNWRVAEDNLSMDIPDTVQGVLRARIDMLEEGPRQLLQIGAVIGKSFLVSVLERVSGDAWELAGHLQALRKAELICEERRLPEHEYAFVHALTHEVTYSSLLEDQRQTIHKKVGETIENLFPERLEEFYGLLAYHWFEAGVEEKAKEYLLKAGDRAHLAYSINEAEGHYSRALELLSQMGSEVEVRQTLMKLAFVHHLAGDYERMNQSFQTAFETWEGQPISEFREEGGILKWVLSVGSEDILNLDKAADPSSNLIFDLLFEGLVKIDTAGNIVPAVAKSWEILDDGTRYLFHLRKNTHWSDGSPVTAHDFEYAWKRNLDPATGSRLISMLHVIEGAQEFNLGLKNEINDVGVKAHDNYTLEVQLIGPAPYFLFILTQIISSPLPRWTIETHPEQWYEPDNIVTNGPFKLIDHQKGKTVTLGRNPNYHGSFPGNLSKIEFRFALDSDEIISLYEADECDIAWAPRKVLEQYSINPELRDYPILGTYYFVINVGVPPFDNVLVRRALFHAVHRDKFAQFSFKGLARGGIIPPSMAGHSPDIGLAHDLERARRLLAEAGYPEGEGFPHFEVACVSEMSSEAEILIEEWQKGLGLSVDLKLLSGPTRFLEILCRLP
jgi:oligopeptide transport system substrate-binding protein